MTMTPLERPITLGLDLGKKSDHSALAILHHKERAGRHTGRERYEYQLRHLRRFPLGTPYREVAQHVVDLCMEEPLRYAKNTTLVVDATGVGEPVYEDVEAKLKAGGITGMGRRRVSSVELKGVMITGGQSASYSGGYWYVPKRILASTVQVLLQNGRLKFAEGLPDGEVLRMELQDFRVKLNPETGHDRYEHREGAHDDLVLALAIAAWYAEREAANDWSQFKPIYSLWG